MNHGFQFHKTEEAPENSRAILKSIEQMQGFRPNLPAAMAESPLALQNFVQLIHAFSRSHFTQMEKEVIFLTIDVENECTYCVAFHSLLATQINMNPEDLSALRAGQNPADPRLGILSEMTRQLVRTKGRLDSNLTARFLEAGYSRENMLEILVAAASQVISNTLNHLAEAPLDSAYQAFQWNPEMKNYF